MVRSCVSFFHERYLLATILREEQQQRQLGLSYALENDPEATERERLFVAFFFIFRSKIFAYVPGDLLWFHVHLQR